MIGNPFGKKPAAAEVGGVDEPALSSVFNWTRNRGPLVHLIGFIVFSVMIHSAGFYLFQVVYPPPVRIEPEGESVTVMDPADPGVRELLERVEDRTVFLFPPSSRSGALPGVNEIEVRFTPSFQATQVEPVPPDYDWDLPPAIQIPPLPSQVPAITSRIEISRSGAIAGRTLAPWSIFHEYLERAEQLPELTITLVAAREGTVSVSDVSGDLAPTDLDGIRQVVESTLRFLPDESESPGSIRIRSSAPRESVGNPGPVR